MTVRPIEERAMDPWFGVWAMKEGYAGHWHPLHGSHVDLQTTRTEAERVCRALNDFAVERTDSRGWSYEVRPYTKYGV